MERKYSYCIENSKDGHEILRVNTGFKKIYTSSKYNTKREIDRLISEIKDEKDIECFYIFGLSNGEYIDDILSTNYNGKIVIVDYFEELIEKYRSKCCEKGKNINIISFKDVKNMFIKNAKIKCIVYGNYREIFENEILESTKLIKESIVDNHINNNTINYFAQIWIENILVNIPHMLKADFINLYKDMYTGKPAIIVSAGPSLENALPYLKGREDNFIIISGGRTLSALKKNNIKVDFTCVIDGSKDSYDVIKDGLDYETTLVYDSLINKKIVEEFKWKKVCFSLEGYAPFIKEVFGKSPDKLSSGGSVAHTCIDFARYIGCNPIIMIGQDLAYTNNKLHADSASIVKDNTANSADLLVESVYGERIPTSYALDSFRRNLESYIEFINADRKDMEFVNSSDGGAKIRGTKFIKFEEVVQNYSYEIDKNINLLDENELNARHVYDRLKKVLGECEKVSKLCDKAIKYNKELKIVYNKDFNRTNYILRELDVIDNKIKSKKAVLSIIWSLLQEISRKIIRDYNKKRIKEEEESLDTIVEKGILINIAIKQGIENTIPIIKQTIDELEDML